MADESRDWKPLDGGSAARRAEAEVTPASVSLRTASAAYRAGTESAARRKAEGEAAAPGMIGISLRGLSRSSKGTVAPAAPRRSVFDDDAEDQAEAEPGLPAGLREAAATWHEAPRKNTAKIAPRGPEPAPLQASHAVEGLVASASPRFWMKVRSLFVSGERGSPK